jgi:hypothetical protein
LAPMRIRRIFTAMVWECSDLGVARPSREGLPFPVVVPAVASGTEAV